MRHFLLCYFENGKKKFLVKAALQIPNPNEAVPKTADSGFVGCMDITDFVQGVTGAKQARDSSLN